MPKDSTTLTKESGFSEFVEEHKAEVLEAQELLATQLSDDPETMIDQVKTIEAHASRIATLIPWADFFLDTSRSQKLIGKNEGTELQREVSLKSSTAHEKRFRDMLRTINDLIGQRISLAQSLIRVLERELANATRH